MQLPFSKAYKLCSPKDFKATRQAKKVTADGIRIYCKLNQLPRPRLGMVIPKREIPNATTRNRLKRVIRETVRLNQLELKGIDLVVIIGKQVLQWDDKRFRSCLASLLQRVITYYLKQSLS